MFIQVIDRLAFIVMLSCEQFWMILIKNAQKNNRVVGMKMDETKN